MASEPNDPMGHFPTSHNELSPLNHSQGIAKTPFILDTYDAFHLENETQPETPGDYYNIFPPPGDESVDDIYDHNSLPGAEGNDDIEDFLEPLDSVTSTGNAQEDASFFPILTQMDSHTADVHNILPDDSSRTIQPTVLCANVFNIANHQIIDLEDYQPKSSQIETEPFIKTEGFPDIPMQDEDVIITSTTFKPLVLDDGVINGESPITMPGEPAQGATSTANFENASHQEPVAEIGEAQDKPQEFQDMNQQTRSLKRAFLQTRKNAAALGKIQQEKVTKAFEAIQRRAARENTDLPAYPSPHPTQGEINGTDVVMSDAKQVEAEDPDTAESDLGFDPAPKFIAAKKIYERRVKQGVSTLEDDIVFRKLEKAEVLRVQRLKARRDYEKRQHEESLFLDQDSSDGLRNANDSSDEGFNRNKRPAEADPRYVALG
jgi:hypothetical protein